MKQKNDYNKIATRIYNNIEDRIIEALNKCIKGNYNQATTTALAYGCIGDIEEILKKVLK